MMVLIISFVFVACRKLYLNEKSTATKRVVCHADNNCFRDT